VQYKVNYYLCTPKTDERQKGREKKRVKDWVLKKKFKKHLEV